MRAGFVSGPRPEGADESQCGPAVSPPDKVMHASFRIGETEIMASDGNCGGKPVFQGVSLAITAASKEKAEKLFAALTDGGQVQMPLTQTFFSPAFGMAADRFGVSWMVVAEHRAPA